MRITGSVRKVSIIAALVALVAMPLAAQARPAETRSYYGPDTTTDPTIDGPCLRGGSELERNTGGACFVVSAGERVTLAISDASGVPQNATLEFLDVDKLMTGSVEFCSTAGPIGVPLDTIFLQVRLVPQTGIATIRGNCAAQAPIPQFHGVSLPTRGTITATFS